jgi:hypothetical protein
MGKTTFLRFCIFWVVLVCLGMILAVPKIFAYYATFADLAVTIMATIVLNPIITLPVIFIPTVLFFIGLRMVIDLKAYSPLDDFILSAYLQEVQGLWLTISFGWFFFMMAMATNLMLKVLNQQVLGACAGLGLVPLFVAYHVKREKAIALHHISTTS